MKFLNHSPAAMSKSRQVGLDRVTATAGAGVPSPRARLTWSADRFVHRLTAPVAAWGQAGSRRQARTACASGRCAPPRSPFAVECASGRRAPPRSPLLVLCASGRCAPPRSPLLVLCASGRCAPPRSSVRRRMRVGTPRTTSRRRKTEAATARRSRALYLPHLPLRRAARIARISSSGTSSRSSPAQAALPNLTVSS
jgi:hypothetical protein